MKKIKITDEYLQELFLEKVKEVKEKTVTPATYSVQINPQIKLTEENKVEVLFHDLAYKKMQALIANCGKEVGWHGIVERIDEKHYEITDIILFPQKVTGATVTPDAEEYTNWMVDLAIGGEVDINKMRFHGHSHVNMATSPSTVDTDYQENVTQNIPDYYIFGIFNKSGSWWLNIFDFENNVVYEKDDIKYLYNPDDIQIWAEEVTKKYVTEVITTVTTYGAKNYASNNAWCQGKVWDRVLSKWVYPVEEDDIATDYESLRHYQQKTGYKGVYYD